MFYADQDRMVGPPPSLGATVSALGCIRTTIAAREWPRPELAVYEPAQTVEGTASGNGDEPGNGRSDEPWQLRISFSQGVIPS